MNSKEFSSGPASQNRFVAVAVALLSLAGSAESQVVTIGFNNVQLQPDMANQPVDLFVKVSSSTFTGITGITTETQSLDANGPVINDVDLFTSGSIFAGNNNGPAGAGAITPRLFERITATSTPPTTIPVGTWKYATAYFDTTGITPGIYPYSHINTPNGSTVFQTTLGDFTPQIRFSGNLTVVPEALSYGAITGIACLAFGAIRAGKKIKRSVLAPLPSPKVPPP